MKERLYNLIHHIISPLFLLVITGLLSSTCLYAQTGWRKADDLFKAMELDEGDWVADVGTREGYYAIRMSPLAGNTGHVFAVDVDENSLEDLHENIQKHNLKNVTPVYSLYDSPTLPANSLDAILVRNAYHEFRDYKSMLAEIKRSLKPGGLLVLSEPDAEEGSGNSVPREELTESHDMSLYYARKELKEAGFSIKKEIPDFSGVKRGNQYWLIIATPADK